MSNNIFRLLQSHEDTVKLQESQYQHMSHGILVPTAHVRHR